MARRGKGKKNKGNNDMAAFMGMMGIPGGTGVEDVEIDDADLEAELLALEGKKPPAKSKTAKGGKNVANLDALIAVSMQDVDLDSIEVTEEDLMDDDLLAELQDVVGDNQTPTHKAPSVTTEGSSSSDQLDAIQARIKLYETAIAGCKEASKVRRYKRAVTSMQAMLKEARAGKMIDLENLPPPVSVKPSPAASMSAENQPPPPHAMSSTTLDNNQKANVPVPAPKPRTAWAPPTSAGQQDVQQPNVTVPAPKPRTTGTQPTSPSQQPVQPAVSKPSPKPRTLQHTGPQAGDSSKGKEKRTPPPGWNIPMDDDDDEFDFDEEELAKMAAGMVDDRVKKPKLVEQDKAEIVSSVKAKPAPTKAATTAPPVTHELPTGSANDDRTKLLLERKSQYLTAAKQAQAKGDDVSFKNYRVKALQFEKVLTALNSGQEIDLSQMPGPPPGFKSSVVIDASKYATAKASTSSSAASNVVQDEDEDLLDDSIPKPKTVLEALEQRLAKYKQGMDGAKAKNEGSKARRMGRIVKQYEEAIKNTKQGKPVAYAELPTPPGYPPIPVNRKPVVQNPSASLQPHSTVPAASAQVRPQASLPSKLTTSTNDKQLDYLRHRMEAFKKAAMTARDTGDRQEAVKHMQYYKCCQKMIEAAQQGLPVDLTQLPPETKSHSPNMDLISQLRSATDEDAKTFQIIENQLQQQLNVCKKYVDVYTKLKNMGSVAQFRHLEQECERDMLAVKGIQSHGKAPPPFTIEVKEMSVPVSNIDVGISECVVEVIQIRKLHLPSGVSEKDLQISVSIEFPYPTEDSPKAKTDIVKETANPEFNHKESFVLDRDHKRSILRAIKRTPLKFEVFQLSRGFLRSKMESLAFAQVKLEPLENDCEISTTLPLIVGKKPIGGEIDIRVVIREPLSGPTQRTIKEKWLVFTEPLVHSSSVPMVQSAHPKPVGSATGKVSLQSMLVPSPAKIESTTSMEALKYELSLVQGLIKQNGKQDAYVKRQQQIQGKIQLVKSQMLRGGKPFQRQYAQKIQNEISRETAMIEQLKKEGKDSLALIFANRKKRMQNELQNLQ